MSETSDMIRKSFAENDDVRDEGLTTPDYVQRFDDIRYGGEDPCQKLDVYRPKDREGETLPVIFSVHGGGWVYGDKERYQYYCMSLTQFGFAVVNFTYRLAPEWKWPAPMEDTNLVVRWILDHAREYDLDTAHIFAVGDSAGASDLGLYAAICTNPDYAAFYPFEVPEGFKPTAIALNCGAYVIEKEEGTDSLTWSLMDDFLPNGPVPEDVHKLCLPDWVTENYVPTYFMTCTGDFLCPQASLLYESLLAHQIPFEFRFYGDKDHELGHVFHLNMKSDLAAKCNKEQCDYFKEFL